MTAQLPWRSLVPGLIAVAALTAIVIGVLAYSGVGRIPGEKARLYVVANQARGVMRGTEVWLEGQRIGTVEEVGFLPAGADDSARVIITVEVRDADLEHVRRDSDVRLRTGTSIAGPMVVYMSTGSPTSQRVAGGDTLFASQSDVQEAGATLQAAARNIDPLMADARTIMSNLRSPDGAIGAALADRQRTRGAFAQLEQLRAQHAATRRRALNRAGQHGIAHVMAEARQALAQVDTIRVLLASDSSSFGRFRRDSTLGRHIASVRDDLATLRATLATHDGTLDRLATDSAITVALAAAQREMALLFEDLRKRPLRYIAF